MKTLSELSRQTDDVALAVRDVARQLHSTILQHLGLPNALKSLCNTFSQQYQITCELEAEPVENLGMTSVCAFIE